MANDKVHWTQTPEGRERMRQIQKESAAVRLKNLRAAKKKKSQITPAGRKKLAAAMRARWKNAKASETAPPAAHNGAGEPNALLTYPNSRKLTKAGLRQLAFDGARVRREWLLRELTIVDMFLKGAQS